MQRTLSLEQVPGYLLCVGEKVDIIEQLVNLCLNRSHSEIEPPIDINETSVFTKLERPTIYTLAQRGEMPAHKQRGKWYFYKSELNEWIKSGQIKNRFDLNTESEFLAANKKGGLR